MVAVVLFSEAVREQQRNRMMREELREVVDDFHKSITKRAAELTKRHRQELKKLSWYHRHAKPKVVQVLPSSKSVSMVTLESHA